MLALSSYTAGPETVYTHPSVAVQQHRTPEIHTVALLSRWPPAPDPLPDPLPILHSTGTVTPTVSMRPERSVAMRGIHNAPAGALWLRMPLRNTIDNRFASQHLTGVTGQFCGHKKPSVS